MLKFVTRELLFEEVQSFVTLVTSRRLGYTGCTEYVVKIAEENLQRVTAVAFEKLHFVITKDVNEEEEGYLRKMMASHCERNIGRGTPHGHYTFHVVKDENKRYYYPMFDKEYVWVHVKETRGLYRDFDRYAGLGYIGDDPLYIIVAEKQGFPEVLWVDDFVLFIPKLLDTISPAQRYATLYSLYSHYKLHISKGYVSYNDPETMSLCQDICEKWDISVQYYEVMHHRMVRISGRCEMYSDPEAIMILHSDIITGCTLRSWICQSVQRSLEGQHPVVILSSDTENTFADSFYMPDGSISVVAKSLEEISEAL